MGRVGFIILYILLSFTLVKATSNDIKVTAYTDKQAVSIGDTLTYTVSVERLNKDVDIELPLLNGAFNGFEVVDTGKNAEDSAKVFLRWFKLRGYSAGNYVILGQTIQYKRKGEDKWQEAKWNDVRIVVQSMLQEGGQNSSISDIRDIKAPQKKTPWHLYAIILGILLAILLGVTIFYIYNKRKNNKFPLHTPTRLAHEIAYEALDTLKQKDYIQKGMTKEFFYELSLIIRYYIENRFNVNAPDMTTEEFLEKVRNGSLLSKKEEGVLKEFLVRADMVKFANYGPKAIEIEESFKSARAFIDETKEPALQANGVSK
ncbi:MAG: hypothetical protein L3V56_02940 [Candidatus Magnetoovum sp. WYHC-5]|nr:hypothetical protein [Candidatus Magnetoovum sp. WYHC-5]